MTAETITIDVQFKGSFAGSAHEVGAQLHERLIYQIIDRASRDWPAAERDALRARIVMGFIGDAAAWLQVIAGHEAVAQMLENLRGVVLSTGNELAAERARRTH